MYRVPKDSEPHLGCGQDDVFLLKKTPGVEVFGSESICNFRNTPSGSTSDFADGPGASWCLGSGELQELEDR